MAKEIVAILITISLGALVTFFVCRSVARRRRDIAVFIAIVAIAATIMLAFIARPLERAWDAALQDDNASPSPTVPRPLNTTVECHPRPSVETGIPFAFDLRTDKPHLASYVVRNGVHILGFEQDLTWAGLYSPLPTGSCDYRFEVDVLLRKPDREMQNGEGWGYGIGPCNVWASDRPHGFSLQYALYQGDAGEEDNSGTFVNPEVNDGTRLHLNADHLWHHWTVMVKEGGATFSMDWRGRQQSLGPFPVSGKQLLPQTCAGRGIFLRVLNATAEFKNFSLVAMP